MELYFHSAIRLHGLPMEIFAFTYNTGILLEGSGKIPVIKASV